MRALCVVLLVVAFAALVTATHWNTRARGSIEGTEMCEREEKDGKWTDRDAPTRCGTCNSRCYTTSFNSTVVANGPPSGLCNETGDNCNIKIYIRTRPCCACDGGTEIVTTTEYSQPTPEDDINEIEIISTDSRCEVSEMIVLINGVWTLPYEPNCDPYADPRFVQTVVGGDATFSTLRDCPNINNAGSRLTQAYDNSYHNGNYPDPCFAAKHWRETFTSQELGVIASEFKMWHPNTNAVWFETTLTKEQTPYPINCNQVPDVQIIA